jgi:hypothetical protein
MGILGKLFGNAASEKTENAPENIGNATSGQATQSSAIPNAPQNTSEQDLIERYAGISFHKQADLYDTIGDNAWNADLDAGEISYGEGKNYPVQALGTYSHQSNNWLWAWANKQADWPQRVQIQANQLKAYGEANNLELLTMPSINTPINDVHLIGLIATGLFDASAYYVADYGQGAMLFLLKTDQLVAATNEQARALTVIPQMISAYEMNHKNAIMHYLNAKSYSITHDKNTLTAAKNGNSLTVEFDALGRLTNLNGQIKN